MDRPRKPIVSIEGSFRSDCYYVARQLSYFIDNSCSLNDCLDRNKSALGDIVSEALRGGIELQDLVLYHLRSANLWEYQEKFKLMSENGITILIMDYVLLNRARLMQKSNVSFDVCPQLDAGLIQPDLQIYLKNELSNFIPLNKDEDELESYQKLNQAFDKLVDLNPEIRVVDVDPHDSQRAANEVLSLYNSIVSNSPLGVIKYYNGII